MKPTKNVSSSFYFFEYRKATDHLAQKLREPRKQGAGDNGKERYTFQSKYKEGYS